jgi:hypothetical protein
MGRKIEKTMVVDYGDGTSITFKEPPLNLWALLSADGGKQNDVVCGMVLDVQGLDKADGTPFTVEDFRGGSIPTSFLKEFVDKWSEGIKAFYNSEAEAKKDESTTASSGS